MISVLCALPLCLSLQAAPAPQQPTASTATPAPVEGAFDASARVHAVLHDSDLHLRDLLIRNEEVWHDAGEFLVGVFSAHTIHALNERGIRTVEVGAPTDTDELWVVSEREIVHLGGKLSSQGRELMRSATARLLALPAGARLAGASGSLHSCHTAQTKIKRVPLVPVKPFTWRGMAGGGGVQNLGTADPRVQTLVDQVDKANLSATVQSLSSLFTRRADRPEAITARNMIQGWFNGFGYSATFENIGSSYAENVIVEIPGTVAPNDYIVIGGHYDSINGGGSSLSAPGADDNASGTAGVLEIARILANAGPFEKSIRFVAFGAEEFGLIGAGVNASNSNSAGQNIVAMLNMDMNAHRDAGDARDCDFATNSTDAALTAFTDSIAAIYVPNWASTSGVLTAGSSDHAAYNSAGIPAAFLFEDLTGYYSQIHTSNDTFALATNDFDLAEMIVKAVMAAAVTLAEPVDLAIAHTPLADTQNASGPYGVSASVTSLSGSNVTDVDLHYSSDGGQNFTTVAMANTGGSNYAADIPGFGAPISIQYYVTAVDDQGGSEAEPTGADLGGAAHEFFVGIKNVIYADGFEGPGDGGWTHGQLATQDDWQRGNPGGTSGDPGSAFEGTNVWGNDIGAPGWNGAYATNTWNWLKSPSIDCSGTANVQLEFRRWLTVEEATYDQAQIMVDGILVWENPVGSDLIDSSWNAFTLDISPWAAGDPSVQVEFRMKSDGGLEYGGWNIDDFKLTEVSGIPGSLTFLGCGVNPASSITLVSGEPNIGETLTFGVDNPLGTQAAGSFSFLFLANNPDANYPCGTLIPNFGMSGAGANGELLISLSPPNPLSTKIGPAWAGAGSPAPIDLSLPNKVNLIGKQFYVQGLILDPVAASGVKFGVTDAVELEIGS